MAALISYVRVSSDGQKDNTSLSSQKEQIDSYCLTHNHTVIGSFQDVESGSTIDQREGFQSALQFLPFTDGMIVFRLDRLTRSVYDAEKLKREFMRQGKLLISVCDNTNIETDEGEFLFTIQMAVSQMERKRILSRAKLGRDKKRVAGQYDAGAPPYGWAALQGKIVALPHEQAVISEMRRRYFVEGHPATHITKWLNDEGIPSKLRKKWSLWTVKRIINGETKMIDRLRESGNILPPEAWEEFAYGKKRNLS